MQPDLFDSRRGPAVTYCGPATATLLTGGKTYNFKNGECTSIKVSGITVAVTVTGSEVKSGSSMGTFKSAPGASDVAGNPFKE
jgi:hypothetical protein